MSEVLNLENIVQQKVQQLCAKNPDYETLMRTIIRVDRLYMMINSDVQNGCGDECKPLQDTVATLKEVHRETP